MENINNESEQNPIVVTQERMSGSELKKIIGDGMKPPSTYRIDWDKVTTFEDMIILLKTLEINIRITNTAPNINAIKKYLIDENYDPHNVTLRKVQDNEDMEDDHIEIIE